MVGERNRGKRTGAAPNLPLSDAARQRQETGNTASSAGERGGRKATRTRAEYFGIGGRAHGAALLPACPSTCPVQDARSKAGARFTIPGADVSRRWDLMYYFEVLNSSNRSEENTSELQ